MTEQTKPHDDSEKESLDARLADLTREVAHWKANHENAVARARVLIERTDMPLERVNAYRHMETLQKLVNIQKMLLEAFSGVLTPPEGVDPFGDGQRNLEDSIERLRVAFVVQQPLPVPDQMAFVWRADLMRMRASWIHRNAYFENNRLTQITVTQNETGEVVAVTCTDAEGQIKEVIWEKP
jgi:hypothetical protein